MSMNKIKTRHTRRAMLAKRHGKHTTHKWHGKYKKHYTRKNVKQIQGKGKGRLRRQRQTRRKVGGLTTGNTMLGEVPIVVDVNSQNIKSNTLDQYDELPVTKEPVTEEPVTKEPVTEEPFKDEPVKEEPENDEYNSLTTDMIKDMLKEKSSFRVSPKCMFLCENDYCIDTKLLEKIRKRFIEFIKRKKNKGKFPYDIDFDFKFKFDGDDDDDDDTDYENLEIQDLPNNSELLAKMLEKNSMFFIVDNLVKKVKENRFNIGFLNDICYGNIIGNLYVKNKLFPILLTLISKIRKEKYSEVLKSESLKNMDLLLELLKNMSQKNMTLLCELLNEMSKSNMNKLLRLLESMTPESISTLISNLKNLKEKEEQKITDMLNRYINLNKIPNSMAQLLELYSFIERTPSGVFLVHRYKDGKTPLGQSLLRNKKHKLETCSSVDELDNQVKNLGAPTFTEDDEFKKVLDECKKYPPSQQVSGGGRKRKTLKKKRGSYTRRKRMVK
jgi:hypothetical protein